MKNLLNYKKVIYLCFLGLLVVLNVFCPRNVFSAVGVYEAIHFQGKVVNSDGTNVSDGNYNFVFSLYTVATGGTAVWTENYSSGNCGQLAVTDGVFSVDLGSCQSLSGVDFNQDSIYLGINFNGDGEMSPRIRFTASAYALNAKKVSGLTVTNTTGTLTIPNGVTIAFSGSNDLTFTTSGTTNATLPSGSITIVDTNTAQTLTNKTVGNTGLVFSGSSIDIDTSAGEGLVVQGRADSYFQTTGGNIILQPAGTSSTAVVKIGSGSGSNTPDLLALDVKNTSGDPTGADGYMYYNSVLGKFRCYQNGSWTDCVGASSGSSPFTSSSGVISKSNLTDKVNFTISESGDYGLLIDTSIAPAVDMLQISNSGYGTVTDGVDGLAINFSQASNANNTTNSAINLNITGSGDAGDVLSGLSISSSGISAGSLYGIKIGGITAGAGTEYALEIGSGWDRGLSVSSTSVFSSSVTAESSLVIGSGSDTFSFDPVSGPVFSGSARPSKSMVLSPEYSGAVLTDYYGAGTDTNINGIMTSDVGVGTGQSEYTSFYQWVRTSSTLHYYTVAVKVALPKDFSAWESSNSLVIKFATNSTSSSDNVFDVYIYDVNNSSTAIVSSTGNVSSTAGAFTTVSFTASSGLDDNSGVDWDSPGQVAIIYLRMGSQNSNWVRVSDIQVNYKAKF
ncbi:MAG: hypothetical protein KatS3mg090_0692 [Patescibacteria group bacterium]|nr:MAG: hypothetical protein KatS3mg090_0692 [Patescibacteria group bacterium]